MRPLFCQHTREISHAHTHTDAARVVAHWHVNMSGASEASTHHLSLPSAHHTAHFCLVQGVKGEALAPANGRRCFRRLHTFQEEEKWERGREWLSLSLSVSLFPHSCVPKSATVQPLGRAPWHLLFHFGDNDSAMHEGRWAVA